MVDHRDPLIDEIHAIRREISQRFGNDPARLVEHYIEYQKQFADRLVSRRGQSPPGEDTPSA